MTLTRRSLLAAALAATPALAQPAFAQPANAQGADPIEALRAFYARPQTTPAERFMTPRLKRLYEAQQRRARRTEDVLPGLDFQFFCGCQDNDDDFATRNTYALAGRTERTARIVVTLQLFAAQPETTRLTFTMALQDGRWLIDDVAGRGGVGDWLWSRLLQMRG